MNILEKIKRDLVKEIEKSTKESSSKTVKMIPVDTIIVLNNNRKKVYRVVSTMDIDTKIYNTWVYKGTPSNTNNISFKWEECGLNLLDIELDSCYKKKIINKEERDTVIKYINSTDGEFNEIAKTIVNEYRNKRIKKGYGLL